MGPVRPAGALAGVVVAVLAATPAPASLEDFENWEPSALERDDEYGLDHYFLFFAPGWEGAWRLSEEGFRSHLGCLTNEVWQVAADLRIDRELAPHLRFRYDFLQREGLDHRNQQHVVGLGIGSDRLRLTPFVRLHPEKARHDVGAELGGTLPGGVEAELAVSFEDVRNNLVYERASPADREVVHYLDRALEWRLEVERLWTARRWIAVEARVLPEVAKRITPRPGDPDPEALRTLDGRSVVLHGAVDPSARVDLEWRFVWMESRREDAPTGGRTADLRRRSGVGLARLSHPLGSSWRLHWGVQGRLVREHDEASRATPEPYRFDVSEVCGTVGASRWFRTWLRGEFGYARQDTKVEHEGAFRPTHGTRSEDRLYLVAELVVSRFRARLHESIELNDEGYSGRFFDKGLVQIQVEL